MVWHGADSRNCSWSSNVVRANTVTISAGTQFKWAPRLQARRSNNSSTECHSRSTEYSAKNYFYGTASWRRCQGLSSICDSEHTMVKSSNDHFKASQKGFREHLLRMICNTSVRGLWQDLRNRSRCKICITGGLARSPCQVYASSLCEDLCKRSCTSSPWQVLCKSCCTRSLRKATCARCP